MKDISWYKGILLSGALMIGSLSLAEGKKESQEQHIMQQQDISAKMDSIYTHILQGSKSLTDQGYLYEIDSQRYNLSTKEDKAYLTIYGKEKDEKGMRQGFYDVGADGVPEVYIQILVYPGRANAVDITDEAAKTFSAKEKGKITGNGKYFLVTEENITEIKDKYMVLIDDAMKKQP